MLVCESLISLLAATREPVSVGGAAAVVVLVLLWFNRRLHDVAAGALGVVADAAESLTTGWSSPPLPAALPGPRGVPVLGYLPFLGRRPHETLAGVAARYGGAAFRLSAGARRFVVISRIDVLRQLADRYANQLRGKPRTFTTQQVSHVGRSDFSSCRRFTVTRSPTVQSSFGHRHKHPREDRRENVGVSFSLHRNNSRKSRVSVSDVSARILARKSVSVSWNASFM